MDTPAPAQPVTQPAPQPITPPMPAQPKSSKLVLILSGIIILLIGLGLGYFLTMRSSDSPSQATKTPTTSVSDTKAPIVVTPTPTTSPEANWLTYTGTKLGSVSLSPYSIKYPATWTPKSTKTEITDSYTLTSGEYQISIYQAPMGGGMCIFEGEVPEGPATDLRTTTFVPIETTEGVMLRRYLSTSAKPAGTAMDFCGSSDGTTWGSPTQFGGITYKIPVATTQEKLLEMDSIIKTLREIK